MIILGKIKNAHRYVTVIYTMKRSYPWLIHVADNFTDRLRESHALPSWVLCRKILAEQLWTSQSEIDRIVSAEDVAMFKLAPDEHTPFQIAV